MKGFISIFWRVPAEGFAQSTNEAPGNMCLVRLARALSLGGDLLGKRESMLPGLCDAVYQFTKDAVILPCFGQRGQHGLSGFFDELMRPGHPAGVPTEVDELLWQWVSLALVRTAQLQRHGVVFYFLASPEARIRVGMTRTRRSFTDEFKREAVKLCKQPGATATHIARDLGIQTSVLRRWVTQERDFTYIWTAEGWLYAAAVMDLYSRRIVGWSMSDTMQAKMVSDALLMALWRRGKPSSLMHHSDQGSQYTSDDFQQLLKAQGITCSMSRRGECWDNAAMESFFSSMKTERLSRKVYRTREEARSDVFDYIERFYNPVRKHSKLDFLSPVDFEQGLTG